MIHYNPFDEAFLDVAEMFTKDELYAMYVNTCKYISVPWKAPNSRFARRSKADFIVNVTILYWFPKEVLA